MLHRLMRQRVEFNVKWEVLTEGGRGGVASVKCVTHGLKNSTTRLTDSDTHTHSMLGVHTREDKLQSNGIFQKTARRTQRLTDGQTHKQTDTQTATETGR